MKDNTALESVSSLEAQERGTDGPGARSRWRGTADGGPRLGSGTRSISEHLRGRVLGEKISELHLFLYDIPLATSIRQIYHEARRDPERR